MGGAGTRARWVSRRHWILAVRGTGGDGLLVGRLTDLAVLALIARWPEPALTGSNR